MIREGSWWLTSEKDSRWNANGRCRVGGFEIPKEALDHIDELKKKLKCKPPKDLEFGYMKD
jgi:hypothetical protein